MVDPSLLNFFKWGFILISFKTRKYVAKQLSYPLLNSKKKIENFLCVFERFINKHNLGKFFYFSKVMVSVWIILVNLDTNYFIFRNFLKSCDCSAHCEIILGQHIDHNFSYGTLLFRNCVLPDSVIVGYCWIPSLSFRIHSCFFKFFNGTFVMA